MRERLRSHLTYANVMVTLLAFIVLGGSAYAAFHLPKNSVRSKHIVNGQVKKQDLRAGAVTNPKLAANAVDSTKVADDSLTGADLETLTGGDIADQSLSGADLAANSLTGTQINESSLGEVPLATLGGLGGQSGVGGPCNPESDVLTACATANTTLPAPSRALVIGQIRAEPDTGGGNGGGTCGVAEPALSTIPVFVNGGQTDVIAISGITGVVGPGPAQFKLYCNEEASGIRYFDGRLTFVALSPNAAP